MDGATFKSELRALGLKQVDFARLLGHLTGTAPPAATTIWRWTKDGPPESAGAALRLFAMLPETKRARLLSDAKAAHQTD